ncbi:c-type cytochrome [Methyloceanibacter caenitepidi]|uniref:Putative cytochrome C-like protein n=1 Tax=Methyloceanibacter caenitepidi TaxID=1384459 RepID=A0A0A8K1M9_9HYPH|nr:cytochrome c [Methyloceanibacter caenitepidi]BAQ16830.1 putative cytochrome C-like protein [Methyloceanibacter caenitepidi]
MKFKLVQLAAVGTLLLTPATLFAHEEATGVVKERMDLMETQKDAMKVLGAMAKGQTPFDAAKATAAAKEIEDTSARIQGLFPEGSGGHPSEAKPEVWTQWAEFTTDIENLASAAAALEESVSSESPEWKAKFKDVIDACKTCHKTFRAEKKD